MPLPGPSVRQRILEAFADRLTAIAIEDGYATDAGAVVYLGVVPRLGEGGAATSLCIVPGEEQVRQHERKLVITLALEVQILARADLEQPWVAIEAAIADVKQAMEDASGNRTLDNLLSTHMERRGIRTLPREPGSTWIGAGVPYVLQYQEGWGAPR